MNIYACTDCNTMVDEIKAGGCHPTCCGKPMTLLVPGTSDGASEKHVPIFEMGENTITVRVGTLRHPMEEVHYIEWIAIETEQGMQRKNLKPGDDPKATFALTEDDTLLAIYAYCNLHGLWKAE